MPGFSIGSGPFMLQPPMLCRTPPPILAIMIQISFRCCQRKVRISGQNKKNSCVNRLILLIFLTFKMGGNVFNIPKTF